MDIYALLHSSLEIVTTLYDRDSNRDLASTFLTMFEGGRAEIMQVDLAMSVRAITHPAAAR